MAQTHSAKVVLEETRAQVEPIAQHQQGNEQAGRAQEHELLEHVVFVDGENGARKRPFDSRHLRPPCVRAHAIDSAEGRA